MPVTRLEDICVQNGFVKSVNWKAYWDGAMRCGVHEGDIRIRDIPVDGIFPDPSVRDGTIQEGQYLCYVYRLHKVLFGQMFRSELAELGISQEELLSRDYVERAGLFGDAIEIAFIGADRGFDRGHEHNYGRSLARKMAKL